MENEQWQVGDLFIDTGRIRVTRGNEHIKLPRLSFDLLMALTRAAPNVLPIETLMAEVWPGVVVSSETVVQRVKLLRDALGDHSVEPRYIASLRSSGYYMIADVQQIMPGELNIEPAHTLQQYSGQSPDSSFLAGLITRRSFFWLSLGLAGLVFVTISLFELPKLWQGTYNNQKSGNDKHLVSTVSQMSADRIIAVLPFRYLGADSNQEYIARALPEIVLDHLATVEGLTVIARESAVLANAEAEDVRILGERLNARYLVEGSVQHETDRVRVSARLIDSHDNIQIWSRNFERRDDDLFALQDEIATELAETLSIRIEGLLPIRKVGQPTQNMNVYWEYLQGRALLSRYTVKEALAAAEYFEKAVEYDPGFANAYAALFDARMQAASLQQHDLNKERINYWPLLKRAIEINPEAAEVTFSRAVWDDVDDEEREKLFRKAIVLDPSNSRTLTVFAEFLDAKNNKLGRSNPSYGFPPRPCIQLPAGCPPPDPGQRAEAGKLLDQAIAINRLSPRAYFKKIGRDFRNVGTSVEQQMMQLLQIDPNFYPALLRVGKYRWLLHDSPTEAITLTEKAIAEDPLNPWARNAAVAYYLDLDDPEAAMDVAQGTQASAETSSVVIALFKGDPYRAAKAAESDRSFIFGFNESWGSAYALRDAALLTGDYAGAEQILRRRFDMPLDSPIQVRVVNFRSYVTLAHLLILQGHMQSATEILDSVIAWIDADKLYGKVYKLVTRAEAQMLLGNKVQALKDLKNSFLVDHQHVEWWYTLRRNPVWNEVRNTPEFNSIKVDINNFLIREREALEEQRRQGLVTRSSPKTAPVILTE